MPTNGSAIGSLACHYRRPEGVEPPPAHHTPGCELFTTGFAMYPDHRYGKLRTLLSPTPACVFPRQAFFLSGAGDTFWLSASAGYSRQGCLITHSWISAFLGQMRRRVARPLSEWSVIDVGGNIGQEAVISALHGFKVLTFEPFTSNVDTIRLNTALNCVHDRVEVVNKGTSDAPGTSCAHVVTDKSYADVSVRPNAARAGNKPTVPGKPPPTGSLPIGSAASSACLNLSTLDLEIAARPGFARRRPLLLKIDNEGNEEATLQGATRLLDAAMPPAVILFEYRGALPYYTLSHTHTLTLSILSLSSTIGARFV